MPFRIKVSLAIVLALLTLLIFGPLIVPIRTADTRVDAASLADADSRFLNLGGLNVHYKVSGTGENTVILLHGFASSTYSWRAVMPGLGDRARAVAFDRPAFGLTERPLSGSWETESPYGTEAQVTLLLELMEALGSERAVLVAHSTGANVALQMAYSHPERVQGLVLIGASSRGPSRMARLFMKTPQLERLGPTLMRQVAGGVGDDFLERAWYDTSALSDETRAAYRAPFATENWDEALWEYAKAGQAWPTREQLEAISVPTLVLSGAEDAVVPPATGEGLAATLDAPFVALEACGHIPQEECPEAFLNVVLPWLNDRFQPPQASAGS